MAISVFIEDFRNIFAFFENFFFGFAPTNSNYGTSFDVPTVGSNFLQCTAVQTGLKQLGEVETVTCRMTNVYWLRIANGEINTMLGSPQGAISKICERVCSREWWFLLKAAGGVRQVHDLLEVPTVTIEQVGNLVRLQIDLSFHLN